MRRESGPVLSLPAGKNLETSSTSLRRGELGASCAAPLRRRMPTTRARRGAAARAARQTLELPADALKASCSTSCRSPTTSLQWRRRATRSTTLRSSRSSAAATGEVVTLAGFHELCTVRGGARDGRVITGSATGPSRCGATARASAPSRRTPTPSRRWRCCRAERASSAPRTTRPRSCGRSTARSSAPSRWAARPCSAPRRCGTACTSWSAFASATRLYHGDGTLVHTFEGLDPRLRGRRSGRCDALAVTPDGQHIISGSYDKLVKLWSVATKSLVSTCARAHRRCSRGGGDARRPAHPQRRA